MKMHIFAVYDAAVKAYMQPFFAPAVGAAVRSLTDAANDSKHDFSRHANDYTLFICGTFDDASGTFETAPPERVVSCLDLVVKS